MVRAMTPSMIAGLFGRDLYVVDPRLVNTPRRPLRRGDGKPKMIGLR